MLSQRSVRAVPLHRPGNNLRSTRLPLSCAPSVVVGTLCLLLSKLCSEAGSASISVEHAPGIFATCLISGPPPGPGSTQVDPPSSDNANIVAPGTASHVVDEPTPPPSLSSLNTFDQLGSGIHSRFPEVEPQHDEQRCRRGRGMDSFSIQAAGLGCAAGGATGQAGGRQKVSVCRIAPHQERERVSLGFLPLEEDERPVCTSVSWRPVKQLIYVGCFLVDTDSGTTRTYTHVHVFFPRGLLPTQRTYATYSYLAFLGQVFHNFVFRRNSKRRSKDPNGGALVLPSSSSSVERNSGVGKSCALASRDDNAVDRSLSAAGKSEGRRREGRSGGDVRSLSPSSSWRQRGWETPTSMEWTDR